MELGGLEEIEPWILSWGRHVRVLAPQKLADNIKANATAVAALYGRAVDKRSAR